MKADVEPAAAASSGRRRKRGGRRGRRGGGSGAATVGGAGPAASSSDEDEWNFKFQLTSAPPLPWRRRPHLGGALAKLDARKPAAQRLRRPRERELEPRLLVAKRPAPRVAAARRDAPLDALHRRRRVEAERASAASVGASARPQ